MKINKHFLQFFAALLILMFHLWFPVSGTEVENFVLRTGYIGVDIFFFLSAYSLADKKIKYAEFIKNRFLTIYIKFLIFVILAAVYKNFSILKTIKIITTADFFERGGGAFLWFVPAIIIFYLLYPLFVKWNFKHKVAAVLIGWLLLSVVSGNIIGYTKVFIFTNRIPVMMAAFLIKTKKPAVPGWVYGILACLGMVILYMCGYKYKLDIPFKDAYFVAGAVFTIGACGISGYIGNFRILKFLSAGTLELYALQMIFGSKLVFMIKGVVGNAIVTNIIVITVMFTMAYVFSWGYSTVGNRIGEMLKNRENTK